MTTRREDIRDALQDAMEDIDTSNTYDRAGTKNYGLTVTEVLYLAKGPDQVDDVERPFIGFRQDGAAVPEYFPGHWCRWTTPWRVYFYPKLAQASDDALYTQINAAMADIPHALHKAARVEGDLRDCITLLNIAGADTSEGSLAGERGFISIDFSTVHWEQTDG